MVDFSVPNLCGASLELNDVLSKLADAKADAKAKLDEAASTAAAAFDETQNELAGLKDKLQSIEIPTLPKLNLQSEITSLLSQVPGSVGYAVALPKIGVEFKDDIESKGLTLETLVSAAAVSSDLICSVVPNLEKDSGSTEPAVEKPVAVKQAAKPAEPEPASKAKQNLNVEVKMANLSNKMSSFFTGSAPPKADTPAFKFPSPDIIKNISVGGAPMPAVVAPTNSSERTNYVPKEKAGIAYKKANKLRGFAIDPTIPRSNGKFFEKLVLAEDGYYEATLEHKPTKIKLISIFPGENFTRELIDSSMAKELGLTEPSSIANKQFYYTNYHGRHQAVLYTNYSKEIAPRTNIAVRGNVVRFFSPIKLSTHPGDIDSGGYVFEEDNPETFGLRPSSGDPMNPRITSGPNRYSDVKGNKKYKGGSCLISYEYLENYDPDYQPKTQKKTVAAPVVTTAPTTGTTTTTTTTGGGSTTTTAAGTTTTPSTTTTTTTKRQPKQTEVEEDAKKVKSAADRKPTTTKEDLQKIADADGFGQTVLGNPRIDQSGKFKVEVSGSAGSFRGVGRTPESAFRSASNKARGLRPNGQPRK